MKITVLVDNFCATSQHGLWAEWGYSILVETPDNTFLLDTGASGTVLLHNMDQLGFDPHRIDALALSHGHSDHTGGVHQLLQRASGFPIWGAPAITRERYKSEEAARLGRVSGGAALKDLTISPVTGPVQILPRIWAFDVPMDCRNSTFATSSKIYEKSPQGELRPDTFADDLSFLVEGDRGWSLLLGCAHAGLPNILNRLQDCFGVTELDTIAGGSHMSPLSSEKHCQWINAFHAFRVHRWRLNHCTGFKAAARMFGCFSDVDWLGVGSVLEL